MSLALHAILMKKETLSIHVFCNICTHTLLIWWDHLLLGCNWFMFKRYCLSKANPTEGSHVIVAWKGWIRENRSVSDALVPKLTFFSALPIIPAVAAAGRSLQASSYFTPTISHFHYILYFPFYSGCSLMFQNQTTVYSLGMNVLPRSAR